MRRTTTTTIILLSFLLVSFHEAPSGASLLTRRVHGGRRRKTVSPPTSNTSNISCDFFHGNWIYDDSYPVYDSSSCPFIDPEFDCQKYGRSDKLYLKYKWQPIACELPRFDEKDFLMRWRGRKMMFVGDSISYNQWQSLLCMLHSAVPDSKIFTDKKDPLSSVTFVDFSLSIMFYRSPYLVDITTESIGRVLKLDSISSGRTWINSDLLIFNTWHWWVHKGVASQGWDYIQDGNNILRDMDRLEAFSKGLSTWAKWVETSLNTNATKVFFQGISPVHYKGQDWGESGAKDCRKETQPVSGPTYPTGSLPQQNVVRNVLIGIKKPVYLLDITLLSQLRKDAHPSLFSGGHSAMDCSHWCLAGLPDTWNQILYAALIS